MGKNKLRDTATIAVSGTTTPTITTPTNSNLVGIKTPPELDGTSMKFKVALRATDTPVTMKKADGSADYEITVAADKYYPIPPNDFEGVLFYQIVMATAQSTTESVIELIYSQV